MPRSASLLSHATLHDWVLPSHGLRVETVDAHAGGQPLRLILSGMPPLAGRTMQERQESARRQFDHLRRAVLYEPRGHPDMLGAVLTPPQHRGSEFGVLFLSRGGFSPLCGHGIIALATILLECAMVETTPPETWLTLDTPAGTIRVRAVSGTLGKVERVFFESVPARVLEEAGQGGEVSVITPGAGELACALVLAGQALFVFVEADRAGCRPEAAEVDTLRSVAAEIIEALESRWKGRETSGGQGGPEAREVYAVVFTGEAAVPGGGGPAAADGRQVCVFADGSVDRSPGGLALTARMALLEHRGLRGMDGIFRAEGLTGSVFEGRILRRAVAPEPGAGGEKPAGGGIISEIGGQAWITGRHSFLIAEDDPFRDGFSLTHDPEEACRARQSGGGAGV